ncbi:MAG: metal-dependent hydrolase [Erythrobacter sp.]|uniref:metal-dependent hydrolase n=1 Tax=Erythrobacter sp. TaxID=1042 RepID=UPI003296FE21
MSSSAILVRQIPFSFDEDINPVWNPQRPEWSHMLNGASLTMPYLEPFLIKTVTEALKQVDDPQLKADVRAFIGQEGAHYKNHRRYNEILKQTCPELADVEDEMEAEYRAFQKRDLKWRLAYVAGFETMTMGITEWLVRKRASLFFGADASVSSLVLWHMVEETEHKNVAYDLYMHLYGDWRGKALGLLCGSTHVAWSSRKGYRRLLMRDGKWERISSRLRLYAMAARFLVHTSPAMFRSLLPGYHPAKVNDPEWVAQWTSAYDGLAEGCIPLLDTSDPEIPARFQT